MTFSDTIRAILKKIKLIIILELLIICAASYVNKNFVPTKYSSTARLFINMKTPEVKTYTQTNLLAGVDLINDYREIIHSIKVRDAATIRIGAQSIADAKVSIYLPSKSRFMELTVEHNDADFAQKLATALTIEFKSAVKQIMGEDNIVVVDAAKKSGVPISKNGLMSTIVVGFSGVIFCALFAVLIAYYDTKIKNQQDVEQALGINVICEFPKVKVKNKNI